MTHKGLLPFIFQAKYGKMKRDMGMKVAKEKQGLRLLILAAAFAASFLWKVNVIWIILCAAGIGVASALTHRKGAGR